LFICGGAFVGLDKIISERTGATTLGFGADVKNKKDCEQTNAFKDIQTQDLIKYGMIPEFVGRLPIVATLNSLDKLALEKILVEPKNAITKQYQKLLAMDNIALTFKEDALREIAKKAIEKRTGARGLRSIIEKLMIDIMFNAYEYVKTKAISITKKMVLNKFETSK
jgi:ATP-dependent Clp protease ATP-binding subunit ClpX